MSERVVQLTVQVDAGPAATADELDALTGQLRRQLLELDVHAVERPRVGAAPAGARSGEAVALGALVVSLAGTPPVLKSLVGTLQAWLLRDTTRSVKLKLGDDTLELTGLAADEQQRLVDLWVARHTRPTG